MDAVLTAVLPVVLLIGTGFVAGRLRLVGPAAVKDLSNLVFLVLTPALLFRSMATADPGTLAVLPLAAYFAAAFAIFFGVLAVRGMNRRAAVVGLAASFSNTIMMGVPLVTLAFGPAGLTQLFTLISVHALVLLTVATVVFELSVVREQGRGQRRVGEAVLLAMRGAIIHPVPLPILAGLAFGQTGWHLPAAVDRSLQLLGQAFGPIALLMVGLALAHTAVGSLWRPALAISVLKNAVHPALVLAIGWVLGLTGLPFAVMVVAACLPVGANVFMFSQRYEVAQDLVTASIAVSTLASIVSLTVVLALFAA